MEKNGRLNMGISMPETYWQKVDTWVSQSGSNRSFVLRTLIEECANFEFVRGELFWEFKPRKERKP